MGVCFYQAFFQKVLDESPPYTSDSGVSFLTGGVGAGSGAGAGAGTDTGGGAGADPEDADTVALRSVLMGLSNSSRRLPLKRSKSSSWDGPVVAAVAAAEDHTPAAVP